MSLSHLEFVKLQHLLSETYRGHLLSEGTLNDKDDWLRDFDSLTFADYSDDNCLHIAASNSNLEAIKLLIKGGLEINAEGDYSYTALDYALNTESREVIVYLLENGANVNVNSKSVTKWIKNRKSPIA